MINFSNPDQKKNKKLDSESSFFLCLLLMRMVIKLHRRNLNRITINNIQVIQLSNP